MHSMPGARKGLAEIRPKRRIHFDDKYVKCSCLNIYTRRYHFVDMLQRICGTRYSPESLTRLEVPGNP